MKQKILEMINQHEETADFDEEIDDSVVKGIENKLGVTFPESYRWFVTNYNAGGICGVYILGYESPEEISVVESTERQRKFGLPKPYVVIEDVDDFVYCLDTGSMKEGECPVITWDRVSGASPIRYNTFYDYVIDRFQEAIDNW
ncbi:SMI1/KNR4 family protein [Ectobacillus panaciterrae]|uniref:SMI1/KNR4 family protein n=1 Tax=Ectobacillus panaciterrae TaxID=363872 RepID=UPI00041820A1|nr:SMI1/KNR4 family protein [Ectobacillus panaciterrae]